MRRPARTLFALGMFAALSNGSAFGQEIVFAPDWVSEYPVIHSQQPITIISERVLATPVDGDETDTKVEISIAAAEQLDRVVAGESTEKAAVAASERETKSCDCDCLKPGGEIWEKLLAQELENARMKARLELEEAKQDLFRDQLAMKVEQKERELRDKLDGFVARERESAQAIQRREAELEGQRRGQDERMRQLEQKLERAEQGNAQIGELKRLLMEARERIGDLERVREESIRQSKELDEMRRHLEEAFRGEEAARNELGRFREQMEREQIEREQMERRRAEQENREQVEQERRERLQNERVRREKPKKGDRKD